MRLFISTLSMTNASSMVTIHGGGFSGCYVRTYLKKIFLLGGIYGVGLMFVAGSGGGGGARGRIYGDGHGTFEKIEKFQNVFNIKIMLENSIFENVVRIILKHRGKGKDFLAENLLDVMFSI